MKHLRKGFTLAELLIVVAIIAVLVGISIPIFTTQLEKSREATDLANVRSAYAVLIASVVADSADAVDEISVDGDRFYTIVPLHQATSDWQTALPVSIAGVSSEDSVHWVGVPEANGTCRIEYDSSIKDYASALTFYWSGEGSGPAHPTDPADPIDPSDPGGPTDPGDSSDPVGPTDPTDPGDSSDPVGPSDPTDPEPSLPQVLVDGAGNYPKDGDTELLIKGHLYNYDGRVYVVRANKIDINPYHYLTPEDPDGIAWGFVELSAAAPVYDTPGHFGTGITKGSLYQHGSDIYIRTTTMEWWNDPLSDPSNWVLIVQ